MQAPQPIQSDIVTAGVALEDVTAELAEADEPAVKTERTVQVEGALKHTSY